MGRRYFKAYSFLCYLLALLTGFFLGLVYADLIDAGKNQGLAAAAIVLGYGFIAAMISLVIAVFVVGKISKQGVVRLNILLALGIVCLYAYFHINFINRKAQREGTERQKDSLSKVSLPNDFQSVSDRTLLALNSTYDFHINLNSMGLGMFKPNLSEAKPVYFYKMSNLNKGLREHLPIDSITFRKREYGGFEIATAPPWLAPAHMKLDYDILLFKIVSLSPEFVEVEVNTTSNKTVFVDIFSGKVIFWPSFLLKANSVEFSNENKSSIYVKPLKHSSKVNASYSYMRPIRIKDSWLEVELLDDSNTVVDNGWIQWRNDSELLIGYSLLY